jgi:DNA-binding NarL/FixJ family response regulator
VEPRQTARALVVGADEPLAALLSDVLKEIGIALYTDEARPQRPDLVLLHVHRGEDLLSALQGARDGTYPAPVFVLLPFADDRLVQRALRLGARGCFALGQPLEALRQMVLAVLQPPRRPTPAPTTKGKHPPKGKYDE